MQQGANMLISKAEYARYRGVSGAMVSKWTTRGQIAIVDGKVDRDVSDTMLAATRDPARGGKNGKSDGDFAGAAPVEPAAKPPVTPGGDTYARVRTYREGFRAKTEEVEYRRTVGELVEKSRYDKALADGLVPILAAMDSLGPRLAPVLAAETDSRRCQTLIEDAVAAVRQDMADTLMRMVTGAGVTQ